jgi:hypothetical protein
MGRTAQRKPESIESFNNFEPVNLARIRAQKFPADFRPADFLVDRQNVCGCHW